MSEEARRRAEEVAAMPHVKAWVKRFRKLVKDMPPELWVFCDSGTPNVMAHTPDGDVYDIHGRMDQGAVVDSPVSNQWDGGGW